MMKSLLFLIKYLVLVFCFCLPALAQVSENTAQHFQSNSLSFNYPADWKLTDQSDDRLQRVTLTQINTATTISIAVARYPTVTPNFESYDLLLKELLKKLGADPEAQSYPQTLEASYLKADGARLHGLYNNIPATGELWTGSLEKRDVVVVRFSIDKEKAESNIVWGKIHQSLKLGPPLIRPVSWYHGNLISLPPPYFPELARRNRINGIVSISVTADEKGKAISARVIKGHPLFHLAALDSARRVKFMVKMLYGKPIRFRYVVSYNFVNY